MAAALSPTAPATTAPPPARHRQARQIVVGAVLMLLVWRGCLAWFPWRADFGEDNYQQNLLRIETFHRRIHHGDTPAAVLAGTSVAGRLLPAHFADTPLAGLVNLGLDGASPAFALELLLRERQVPQTVYLETFLLHKDPATNETLIRESLDSPSGRLAAADRLFHTETRPTALLYSALKRGRDSAATGRPAPVQAPYQPIAPSSDALHRITHAIEQLQARGSTVVLVDVPVGKDWPPGPNLGEPTASLLVNSLKLPRLDCRAALQSQGIEPRFTDGVHLDAASAREVARQLARLGAPGNASPEKTP